jgi:hypothetical protein
MTPLHPPRFALALLLHLGADCEPLVGDLIEEFGRRRSRLWFWRQALYAVLMNRSRQGDDARPLRLVDEPSFLPAEIVRRRYPATINLSGSPLPDIGGLGLIVLGTLVTVVRPQVWAVLLAAAVGGVALGITLVLIRKRQALSASGSDDGGRMTLLARP